MYILLLVSLSYCSVIDNSNKFSFRSSFIIILFNLLFSSSAIVSLFNICTNNSELNLL